MAVNLLEEDQLVYHDSEANTLEIKTPSPFHFLDFYTVCGSGYQVETHQINVNRDAVETLRDSLTCWLETGKLK